MIRKKLRISRLVEKIKIKWIFIMKSDIDMLLYEVSNGQLDAVKLLIEKGANVNAKDRI